MQPPLKPLTLPLFLLCVVQAASPADARAQAKPAPANPAAAPSAPVVLQAAPDGDTLAVLPPGARVQALGRQGEWTRVRVEGWTRSPVAAPETALSPSLLRAEPEAHNGRSVAWSARFLALQRADEVRTDFSPGELYVLARDPNGEPGFVYIAVTPEQALAVRRLIPLQRFDFVGRVRAGASPLMGHPILELVELRP